MGNQSTDVKILLLGSVQVWAGTQRRPLPGRRQRIAVARLALAEGRAVPVSALIDDLWGEETPRKPLHALQTHLHRLRTSLTLDIEFVNTGYRLVGTGVSVDATEFTEKRKHADALLVAGDHAEAASAYEAALDLWRGRPLEDVDDVPGLNPFARWLTELRRSADSDRIEALLRCGRHEGLIGDLRASLALDPLRETTWHQLMRALWQAGQEAEALATYSAAREAFIRALGSEPGSSLTRLRDRILQRTPGYQASSAAI